MGKLKQAPSSTSAVSSKANGKTRSASTVRGRPKLPVENVRKSATLRMSDTERQAFQECADFMSLDLTTWMRWTLKRGAETQKASRPKGTKSK